MAPPPLILLAGTSEAGKSGAGEHFAAVGAYRLKIRPVLLRLTSGRTVQHEGVATRELFDPAEFVALMVRLGYEITEPVLVVESFIDVSLAEALKSAWPQRCVTLFVTAPLALRAARLAHAERLAVDEAERLVRRKDARKRVAEQHEIWRETAEYWIDNTGDLTSFHARLDAIYASLRTSSEDGPA